MAKSSTVSVKIAGDARSLQNAVKDADSSLGKLGRAVGDVGKKVAIGFAAVGGAAVAGLAAATKAAIEDEKSQKLLATAIKNSTGATKDQIKAVEDYISKTALATGVVDDELRPAFSTLSRATGDLSKSQELLGLAQDISAGTGKDLGTVALTLAKAYGGNVGGLKRLGIQLDDSIVKNKDFAGAQKVLTDQFKGSAKSAADTYEGRLKRVKVALGEASEQIGYAVLPMVSKMLGFFTNRVVPGVQKLADVFSKEGLAGVFRLVVDKIKEFLPIIKEKLAALGQALIDWIGPRIKPMLQKLGEFIGKAANWILDVGLPWWIAKLQELGQALVDWIGPRIAPMLKEMGRFIGKLAEWALTVALPKLAKLALEWAWSLTKWAFELAPQILLGLGQAFVEIVKKLPGIAVDLLAKMGNLGLDIAKAIGEGIINGIKSAFNFAGNFAKDIINGLIDWFNRNVIDWINTREISFLGKKIGLPDIPDIPKLAKGGIVTKPTLALIGEKGPEAVVPLPHKMSMPASTGDTYVTIQVTKADPDAVVAALRRYMNTNGSIPIRTSSAI